MSRSITRWAHALVVTLSAATLTAVASPTPTHAQEAAAVSDAARIGFARAGFAVSPAIHWWTGDLTSFTVSDARETNWQTRVVMVLFYRDDEAADTARREAQAHNRMLVPGYGEAAWLGNVAMVQSNTYELSRLAQQELDRDLGISVENSVVATPSRFTVDDEFVAILSQALGRADL
jgi:hypothetical protein